MPSGATPRDDLAGSLQCARYVLPLRGGLLQGPDIEGQVLRGFVQNLMFSNQDCRLAVLTSVTLLRDWSA